jgi:hypothetical protein
MHPVAFSLQFQGFATHLSPSVLTARASAPSAAIGDHEALIERRLTFIDDARFEEVGTISFGNGNALRYRSVDAGKLVPSPDAVLRQGTAVWSVEEGSGILSGVSGRIVSNFLVSAAGELTDHEIAVLFVDDAVQA